MELRKYRIFNIALFDVVSSFLGAFILDKLFSISSYFPGKNKKIVYYLSVIPIGVLIHLIFSQNTFLNQQLFDKSLNGYKISFGILLFLIILFIFA